MKTDFTLRVHLWLDKTIVSTDVRIVSLSTEKSLTLPHFLLST